MMGVDETAANWMQLRLLRLVKGARGEDRMSAERRVCRRCCLSRR